MLANPHVERFRELLSAKFTAEDKQISMSDWICQHTTLRKKPFSFNGYEFQRKIVDDLHEELYCRKISQVGLTETQFRKFLALLKRNNGRSGIFTLPNEEMYERLAVRVKMVLDSDGIFNEAQATKPIRRKEMFTIDQSIGYLTGMTEGDATSIPADILFHDELDLSDQNMIGLYQSRLQNSDMKLTQHFSTPKYTGFGIDKGYQSSDQFEYLCRCTRCNHWQAPEFSLKFMNLPGLAEDYVDLTLITDDEIEAIDFSTAALVCEKCRRPLDYGNPETREWVAKHPGKSIRGYYVSPFATDRLSLKYIFGQLRKQRELDNIDKFHNTVLGLPYDNSNTRLSQEDIEACMGGMGVPEMGGVFVGIDVGQMCHVVIGPPGNMGRFDTVPVGELLDYVGKIRKQYNIIGGAIDRHPYTPTADAIRELTQGAILPVEYRGTVPTNIRTDEFDNITHVQVDRTRAIDAVANDIRHHRTNIAGYTNQRRILIEHFRDMVRIEEPEKAAVWEKVTGKDHYFHAAVFKKVAERIAENLTYNNDADLREVIDFGGITSFHQFTPDLGVKSRMKTHISPFIP